MTTATLPAGAQSVTLDAGTTDNSLFITNTGQEDAFLHPGARRLRPGQSTSQIVNPGVAVTATSRNGSTLSYTVGSEGQPGSVTSVKYTEGTAAAQPTAAVYGAGFYKVTDLNGGQLQHSDGSAWTNVAPGVSQAATPALVASAALGATNFTTSSATDVDVTGLSITFTAVAGVTYTLKVKCVTGNSTSGDSGQLALCDSSNTVLDTAGFTARSTNDSGPIVLEKEVTPGAGSVTYKVRLHAGTGGTAFVLCAATIANTIKALRN